MQILTPPEKKLIFVMKHQQKSLNRYVAFDNSFQLITSIDDISLSKAIENFSNGKSYHLKISEPFIMPSLKSLIANGLVKAIGSGVYQVTLNGWYCGYVRRREVFDLILKNVIIPIAVSVITTLITLAIT